MQNILEMTACEMAMRVRRRELSPVDLLDACLARIEEINPVVNAIVAIDEAGARLAAQRAEAALLGGETLGPLHGLPVAIKDLNPTRGLRTTFGSLVYRDNVPHEDDLVVSRIRQAGGIILAKSNTPEFGAGANTINRVYGATVNPFAPDLSAAGSSGGSAVALATGMVPLASGSDMGGSLRTPASFSGVVGHRPSAGAVPSSTRRNAWSPLSTDGPMGRTVADTALQMAAMVGASSKDPLSFDQSPAPFLDLKPIDLGDLRVAFSSDLGGVPVACEVRTHFDKIAEGLAPLFKRAERRDPELGDVHRIFETLRGADYADAFGGFVEEHRGEAGPNVIRNVDSARLLTTLDIARANADQSALVRGFQSFFDDVDLLICPAASVVPFPVEEVFVAAIDGETLPSYVTWIAITYALTLTTHPATVIPCGLGPTGLPFGIQIVGRWRDDAGTLAAAAALERELSRHPLLRRPVPNLGWLATTGGTSWAGRVPAALEQHAHTLSTPLASYRNATP